jgi:hypothetical protein
MTAEEFYLKETGWDSIWDVEEFDRPAEVIEYMKNFAKYHVEEALKAKVKAMKKESEEDSSFSLGELDAFTKEAYPLNKII